MSSFWAQFMILIDVANFHESTSPWRDWVQESGLDSTASERRVATIGPGQLKRYAAISRAAAAIHGGGHVGELPTVGQVNRYGAAGGCPMHVDARGVGAAIAMLSLQSPAVLELVCRKDFEALVDLHGCGFLIFRNENENFIFNAVLVIVITFTVAESPCGTIVLLCIATYFESSAEEGLFWGVGGARAGWVTCNYLA
jgi:hypothetical protein